MQYDPRTKGLRATHVSHNKTKGNETKYFATSSHAGYSGKELEKLCRDILYKNGHSCVLEPESIKGFDGNELPALDTTTNGKQIDIKSITENNPKTILNGIKAKSKQIKNVFQKTGYRGDSLIIYIHEPSVGNYERVKAAFEEYRRLKGKTIKSIYCVIGKESKVFYIE